MPSTIMKIVRALSRNKKPMSVKQLHKAVGGLAHTMRARLSENAGGAIERVGKGLYIAANTQTGITADSRQKVRELADAGYKADFVMLDLPYATSGQRGGNRNLAPFPVIDAQEFADIVGDCARILRNDNSPAIFIFSSGKTSAKARAQFKAAMDMHMVCAGSGEYTKTYQNGNPVQFMGKRMPTETIFVYTRSGEMPTNIDLDIHAVRPPRGSYPTQKPDKLLKKLIGGLTSVGAMVLDPFAGSGSTSKAAAALGRGSLNIDIITNPVS